MKWLVIALAACTQPPTEMFPVNPGGGGAIGSSYLPDAAIATGDGSTTEISGRVCVVSDARNPVTCAAMAGLTVRLGTATTTTAADGTFKIARPLGTGLIWRVDDARIAPSAMRFSTDTTIPALDATLYQQMLAATLAIEQPGDGAVIARFVKANAPVVGATVAASPAPEALYYDDVSVLEWDTDATGAFGVAWIPSIAPTTNAQLQLQSTTTTTFSGIPVFADTITFELLEVP